MTSTVSTKVLGFDGEGQIVNHKWSLHRNAEDFVNLSTKMITFIDVAGREKYFKTLVKGLLAYYPDYICVVLDGQKSLTPVDREHISLARGLKLPVFFVVTKVDLQPQDILKDIQTTVPDSNLILVDESTDNFTTGIPVFPVSCTTAQGIPKLVDFLKTLQPKELPPGISEFKIGCTYKKNILAGIVTCGAFSTGQSVLIGPNDSGNFSQTVIKKILCQQVSVGVVKAG